jgi:predicted metal-dependent peptidase
MSQTPITQAGISAALMRICQRNAFFATLALHAKIEINDKVPTAATDGMTIFVNPDFFAKMSIAQQEGVLLHEVLHAAMLHVQRRNKSRDPMLWNIAADIVVNGIVLSEGYELPEGGVIDRALEHFSVEEVYELKARQQEQQEQPQMMEVDLLDEAPNADGGDSQQEGKKENENQKPKPKLKQDEVEGHWRSALQQAKMVAESAFAGKVPGGIKRELERVTLPQLDWRSYLWRYLVQTPTDFGNFDRRFIGDGTYLETLDSENVRVAVCVDTSGSIDTQALMTLVAEVRAILEAYPHLKCDLYYADTEVHGPFSLAPRAELPEPIGGGGTDFRPFFDKLESAFDPWAPTVAVYLTDGYGSFPERVPQISTLWVVTAGGLPLTAFPFGERGQGRRAVSCRF